jgi:pimeloyl-ACP methyl ester carboxylesterase
MPYVTSRDGTKIAFEESGQGPVAILVDGAMGHRGYMGMTPLAAELAGDLRVVAYDRRGRGDSGDTQHYAVDREIEDIEALIAEVGGPVCLYGFSSGSVLALRAAAKLADRVAKLALLEPPLNPDDDASKQEFKEFTEHMAELLEAGRRGDAVAFFLADMLPPEVLEGMKESPEWKLMEGVAPTLAYDNVVMGDGSVPTEAVTAATMPALVLDGGESDEFRHAAADALAAAMPHAERKTLEGHGTLVPPEVLAPVLKEFFTR